MLSRFEFSLKFASSLWKHLEGESELWLEDAGSRGNIIACFLIHIYLIVKVCDKGLSSNNISIKGGEGAQRALR